MLASVGGTFNVTVNVAVLAFPAASRAVAVRTFTPLCSATVALQFVVPAAIPLPPRLFVQLTCVTPTLSLAVPASESVATLVAKVDAVVGLVIATTGAVVSDATMVHVNVRDADRTPSETDAVTVNTPALVGVPLMRPVDAATKSPAGRPAAAYVRGSPSGSEPASCSVAA